MEDLPGIEHGAAEAGVRNQPGSHCHPDDDDLSHALTCDQVRFAHAVNSAALLSAALRDPAVNFIECDVVCNRCGSASRTTSSPGSPIMERSADLSEEDSEDDSDASEAPVESHGAGAGARASADGSVVPPTRARVETWLQPVMGHDPGCAWDLSFSALVDGVIGSGKGLKVDIKEWDAVPGVLSTLRRKTRQHEKVGGRAWPSLHVQAGPHFFHRPALMINADVLTGTVAQAGGGCKFNAEGKPLSREAQLAAARAFIEAVGRALPSAILSIGWTTAAAAVEPISGAPLSVPYTYSSASLEDMAALTRDYAACGVAFTYPVRAQYVRHCWPLFKAMLVDPAPSSTITLWSHAPATAEEMTFFGSSFDPQRTMYDLAAPAKSAHEHQQERTSSRGIAGSAVTIAASAAIGAVLSMLLMRYLRGKL